MKSFVQWTILGILLTLNFHEVQLAENNTVPIYLKFRFFNTTNPNAILNGEKPILVEVGPYVYEEKRLKTVKSVDEESDTTTYEQNITYWFRQDMSEGHTEDDLINIPNGAFLIITNIVFTLLGPGPIGRSFVEYLVSLGETFVKENVRVGDAIFNGYEIDELYANIFEFGGLPQPPEFEGNRFGFYRGRNGTSDGEHVVRVGATDSSQIGQIKMWDSKTELDWWYPPAPEQPEKTYCNGINGIDGFVFQPFIKKDTVLYTFFSDDCRSTSYVYEKDIEHLGFPGYQFVYPDNFFDAPEKNPDNLCFCPTTPMNLTSECKGGIQRLFPCKSKWPIVSSSPHFWNAFPGYRDNVTGLNPIEDKHKTILQVWNRILE